MAKQYNKIFIRFIKEQNKYKEFVTWNQNYFKLYTNQHHTTKHAKKYGKLSITQTDIIEK